jgi:hypothetical protein
MLNLYGEEGVLAIAKIAGGDRTATMLESSLTRSAASSKISLDRARIASG